MRPRRRTNARLWAAFALSLVLHLSIVTVFEVVIFFPREDIEYHRFEIVDPRSVEAGPPGARDLQLDAPSPDDALQRVRAGGLISDEGPSLPGVPDIELPKLEFAQMDLLRMRSRGIEVRSRYEELFENEPDDLWARFGRGVSQVGDALQRFTFGDETEEANRPVSRPAPGFEAYVEWLGPPRDRKPLAIEKVQALWGRQPEDLAEPVVLFFQVDRSGKVVSVLPQMTGDEELVDSASQALIQYRFEPVAESGPDRQRGTFIIRAAEDGL